MPKPTTIKHKPFPTETRRAARALVRALAGHGIAATLLDDGEHFPEVTVTAELSVQFDIVGGHVAARVSRLTFAPLSLTAGAWRFDAATIVSDLRTF